MSAESSDGEKRLYMDLLSNSSYNTQTRPRHDPTQTVLVDLELDLNHLIKLVSGQFNLFDVMSVVCYTIGETFLQFYSCNKQTNRNKYLDKYSKIMYIKRVKGKGTVYVTCYRTQVNTPHLGSIKSYID